MRKASESSRVSRNTTVKKEKAPSTDPKRFDEGLARLWVVGVIFTVLLVALWWRAFELQVLMGPELAAKANRQHTAKETVVGVRGSILDRNGNILARSIEASSVWANPRQVKDKFLTVTVLSKILEAEPAKLSKLLEQDKKFVWVVRKINDTVAKQIKEAGLPGIYLDEEFERVYPYKTLAGQLLGFVNVDDKGIEGLEKSLEEQLSASTVKHVIQRDATGRRLGGSSNDASDLRGNDVVLTIDSQVQFFAEEALASSVEQFGAKWGGCLVVDVPTGDVLAWAQYPFFDPNAPGNYSEKIRRNRLAADALEQGSTIKSFLIAAALEEKVVSPATEINCEKGVWKIGRFTIHDTHSYSILPVRKILHVSSNIGVAKIGLKLGAEKYYSYLKRLGFGDVTSLPLAGQSKGILRAVKKWQEIDLATASFGQSFSATLAQMANAYLCLASDGVARNLRITLDEPLPEAPAGDVVVEKSEKDRIFSSETMRQVRSMLREVVEEEGGTGKQARIPSMIVGGKTGTAQKADRSGKYGSGRVASFVGMVPIDTPRYLVCVILDEPVKNQYGGIVAAPVFRQVALRTMAYHGLLPDSDDPLVKAIAEKEQQRRQTLAEKSGRGLKKSNPAAEQVNEVLVADTKREQVANSKVQRRGKTIAPSPTVPNVTGLGVSRALEIFAAQGVIPVFQGKGGFIVRQSPAAGAPWPTDQQQCTLWLEEGVL